MKILRITVNGLPLFKKELDLLFYTQQRVNEYDKEKLWEKPVSSVKSKKYLTDFSGLRPIAARNTDEAYLPDDVSFIIAHNKKTNDRILTKTYH